MLSLNISQFIGENMEGKKLILDRRSIRKFSDYHVSDEELMDLLEAAQYAPSWANKQSSYFVVLRDKDIIQKLTDEAIPNNPATNCCRDASLIIIACYEKGLVGQYKEYDFNKVGTWAMFDLGMACQNISLRAHELGLGSVIVGAYHIDIAKKIINLDDKYEIAAIIPIGKRLDNPNAPKRKDINTIFHTI